MHPAIAKLVHYGVSLPQEEHYKLVEYENKLLRGGDYWHHVFDAKEVEDEEVRQFLLLTTLPYVIGDDITFDKEDLWQPECVACVSLKGVIKNRLFLPLGNLRPSVFVVGDAPGWQGGYGQMYTEGEDIGRMWVNPGKETCDMIRGAMFEIGLHHKAWYTNLIRRSILRNEPSTDQEIETCTRHLEKELQLLQPKVVFLLGNHVTNHWPYDNIQVIGIYHPAYAVRKGMDIDAYAQHIKHQIATRSK
jgi:uracil-DNA glycosylase family 4